MNSKSFKRISRSAAILTAPVAAAMMISSAPANAATETTVTTTIEYDYVIAETADGNGTLGVEGEIPLIGDGDPSTTLYGTYETDDYAVGFEQGLGEDGETVVWGEVYPTDELTVGAEHNITANETTVYADYETDNYAVGGEYTLQTGEGSVYGEIYPADGLTLGVEADTDGNVVLYGEYEVNDNLTVGGEYNVTNGEASVNATYEVPLSTENPEVTVVTEVETTYTPESDEA